MIDLAALKGSRLRGGFVISEIEIADKPLVDALGRGALAKTVIVGASFAVLIQAGMDERELSVTLYHEILEAASVASSAPPASVLDFNEADFERTAYAMHDALGAASPENLNRMLQLHGFDGE